MAGGARSGCLRNCTCCSVATTRTRSSELHAAHGAVAVRCSRVAWRAVCSVRCTCCQSKAGTWGSLLLPRHLNPPQHITRKVRSWGLWASRKPRPSAPWSVLPALARAHTYTQHTKVGVRSIRRGESKEDKTRRLALFSVGARVRTHCSYVLFNTVVLSWLVEKEELRWPAPSRAVRSAARRPVHSTSAATCPPSAPH